MTRPGSRIAAFIAPAGAGQPGVRPGAVIGGQMRTALFGPFGARTNFGTTELPAVRSGAFPEVPCEKRAIVVRFGREFFRDRRMSAATFSQAARLLGIRGVTDLAGLMAFYGFLYNSSNATFDIQLPEGQPPLLPLP